MGFFNDVLNAPQKPSNVPEDFWASAVFVGTQYGVDPYLLSAIGEAETNFGQLGAGRDGYALGVGVYNSGSPNSQYKGLMNQLTWAAKSISNNFNGPISEQSIQAYNSKVHYSVNNDGSVNQQWGKNVWSDYQSLNASGAAVGNTFKQVLTNPMGAAKDAAASTFTSFLTMNNLLIVGGLLGIVLILVNMAKGGGD